MNKIKYIPLSQSIEESNSELEISPRNDNQINNATSQKGSPIGAVFIIVNAALGAGLLSFPQAFMFAGGVIPGLVLEICLAILMAVNLVVVAYATDVSGATSYQQMVGKMFGPVPAIIIQVSICILVFASIYPWTRVDKFACSSISKIFLLIEQLLFAYYQDILANRRTIAHWVYDISC